VVNKEEVDRQMMSSVNGLILYDNQRCSKSGSASINQSISQSIL